MFKIGVVGGIGSGKSTATKRFQELGCGVINADLLAHKTLEYPEVIDQIKARWNVQENGCVGRPAGCDAAVLLGPAGKQSVSRPAVSEVIFNNVEERKFLEAVMHPLIEKDIHASLTRYNPEYIPAVILDVPLLFEAGWEAMCDYIVFIECPRGIRFSRYCRRRGITDVNDFKGREAAQLSVEEKAKRANTTLVNEAELPFLLRQVDSLWHNILRPQIIKKTPENKFKFWKLTEAS